MKHFREEHKHTFYSEVCVLLSFLPAVLWLCDDIKDHLFQQSSPNVSVFLGVCFILGSKTAYQVIVEARR